MDALLDKIGIRGKFRRNFGAIVMLAVAGCAIFGLPFFRFEYYDAYLHTYNLTNTQMGVFGTIIGVFGIVSYLFGGVVADGMSVRKVIALSPIVTGVAGLFHLLPLDFHGLLVIYAVWGVSTTFAFQPACVKAVRVMADDESQGKAYGFFEGTQGVFGAIVAMIALAIFNWGNSGVGDEVAAMRYAIVFYSLVNIALGVFAYVVVKDDRIKIRADKVSFKGIAQVIMNPAVWIICLVAFCNHVFCLSVYYYIPYVTDVLTATVAFGAMLGIFRKWGGVIGNILGGYLADRFGTRTLMLFAYAAMLVCQIVLLLLPTTPGSAVPAAALFAIIFIFFQMNMAVSWTMMSEGAVPVEYSGTAAGLICTAGALPETFVSLLAGSIIDTHPGAAGFHYFFYFLTAVIAVGLALILVWRRYLKSDRYLRERAAFGAAGVDKGCMSCHTGVATTDDVSAKTQMSCRTKLNVVDDEACATGCAAGDEVAMKAQMSCRTKLNVVDDDDCATEAAPDRGGC